MLRKVFILMVMLIVVAGIGFAVPAAKADCQPDPGTGSSGDDTVVCNGDDADGVNVGTGNDSVEIISGTVLDTIISEGGSLLVVMNGGALDTSALANAVEMFGSGDVTVLGDLLAGNYGILITGSGNVNATGNINAGSMAIIVFGNGNISSTGNLTAADIGIYLIGHGTVTSVGDISAYSGIYLAGGGDVTSTGNITSGGNTGIVILNGGNVISTGNINSGGYGIEVVGNGSVQSTGDINALYYGIVINGDGSIWSVGDVSGKFTGIYISGNGSITSVGDIHSSSGDGIDLYGNGSINSSGSITATQNGIYIEGNGSVDVSGSITAGTSGINGGPGAQSVDVYGSINAPVAVRLNDGNDSLHTHSGSDVQGAIQMGGGDDTVIIGDNSVIHDTILGGETNEVNGDTLMIGDTQICSEDGQATATAHTLADQFSGLNPDSDTVTYLGQTYTWAEFEHITSGMHFSPCIGWIDDGRINAYDIGAPDALYCVQGGGVSVWDIDTVGQGTFSFAITTEQIEAAFGQAVSSGQNTLIEADEIGNAFYALSDGHTIQFNAPETNEPWKTYTFQFEKDRCPAA